LAISLRRLLVLLGVLLAGPTLALRTDEVSLDRSWSTASHDSAGLVPPAAATPEAVVQVYAARAFDWRGAFAVHTWVAVKPEKAPAYATSEIIGWRYWRDGHGISLREGPHDRHLFGSAPQILVVPRGSVAAASIPQFEAAAVVYPFANQY